MSVCPLVPACDCVSLYVSVGARLSVSEGVSICGHVFLWLCRLVCLRLCL